MTIGTGTGIEGATKPSSIEVDGYEPSVFAHRFTQIESNQQAKFDYSGGTNVIYAGYAPRGLATSASSWILQKFVYDGNNNVTSRQIAYDAWDNRATSAVYA